MRFLIDECTGTSVSDWLKEQKHEVFSVFEELRGASDEDILKKCVNENYILITSDKDFGEMVFRNQSFHKGIILIRCSPNIFSKRIEVLSKLLDNYSTEIADNFVVVTNTNVRIIKK